jgi:hypothetical protein
MQPENSQRRHAGAVKGESMNLKQQKWMMLAAAGSISGITILVLFRSIPIAAGTGVGIIVGLIVVKHLALVLIISSPLAVIFRRIRPKIRSHCPFARS